MGRRKAKTTKSPQPAPPIRERLKVAWTWTLRLLLVALVGGGIWGSVELRDRVVADPRFHLGQWTLQFGEFPAWVTPEIRQEIEAINATYFISPEVSRETVFRKGVLREIRDELMRNAWIRRVPTIKLYYPGGESRAGSSGLFVEVELRRPIAAVYWGSKFYLADAEYRRVGDGLPGYSQERFEVPVITGTRALARDRFPGRGEVWESREVLEGLSVAHELFKGDFHSRHPGRITEINVKNVGGLQPLAPEIYLRAVDLPILAWGRSPISRGARVLRVEQILANLERVLSSPPRQFSHNTVIRLYTSHLVGDTVSRAR